MLDLYDMWRRLFGPAVRRVAVAVVARPGPRFLVAYNPRWGGYSFPMRKIRVGLTNDPQRDRRIAADTARDALVDALGAELGQSEPGRWLDRIRVEGVSGRDGRRRVYDYDIVEVRPRGDIPEGAFGTQVGFLTPEEIRESDPAEPGPRARLVTWTTWQVLTRLLDNQRVAAAVIRRGDECLMERNRYGEWFFPARRIGPGRTAWQEVGELLSEWNTLLGFRPAGEEVVEMPQSTEHLGRREYEFRLCGVEIDVARLEKALGPDGHIWRHPAAGLPDMSPTLAGLAEAALRVGR
jgi:hypothetical protein